MKVKEFRLLSHMNLSNQGVRVEGGEIDCPENIVHGKLLLRIIRTPKRNGQWGTGKVYYALNEEKSKEFKSLEDFKKFYKIND